MTTIRLHNTRTRKKEEFVPLDPENVRMYVCGPTVYDRAHLGNARPVVVFDVLYRLLRHVYGPDHVTYVRNFTDVDDKINARAAETGRPISEITAETTQWFLDDMRELGALEPDHMPRATQYIGEKQPDGSYNHMIGMIEDLIAKGHAYEAEGHVLFAVDSWREGYGKLSGRSVEDMIAGARVEVAPYKRNPMDFVLWKPSDEGQPGWDSPWGYGRPGWHIECSAMAYELLGESFDIHGGGNDLMFPHHENEIAQSCCAHPEGQFARVWMHNEMLQVEGKKMSKSLGNFFTVRDLLEGKTEFGNVTGPEMRMAFLMSHYRSPMDFSHNRLGNARKALNEICENLAKLGSDVLSSLVPQQPIGPVIDHLSDDLETPAALAELRVRLLNKQNIKLEKHFLEAAVGTLEVLGLDLAQHRTTMDFARLYDDEPETHSCAQLANYESQLTDLRTKAKETKDFSKVDELKSRLTQVAVEVRMTNTDVFLIRQINFNPAKLEALK